MTIRPCTPVDLPAVLQLFYDAVHTACAPHYTPAQLSAWAPEEPDTVRWADKLRQEMFLKAEEDGILLGFGALEEDYLDLLYVRPDWQGRGVGTVLCDFLERGCTGEILTVHASRAARLFFQHRGYRLVRAQQVSLRGQTLENFVMKKELI